MTKPIQIYTTEGIREFGEDGEDWVRHTDYLEGVEIDWQSRAETAERKLKAIEMLDRHNPYRC